MKLEGGSGKRAGAIVVAIVLALSSLSSSVVANDERECVDLLGVCIDPQINEDLLVCVTDANGKAASDATVTVTQGSPLQQTTGSDGCTEFEDLSCGDEATVEVSKNSKYWGQDTTTVTCKASDGDSHDHDTYDFEREGPYIVEGSENIPAQRTDGQTIPFSVEITHNDEDIDPHDVTVDLRFEDASGFGACTSMDKSESKDVQRGSEILVQFECTDRIRTGSYDAQITVQTHSYGTQDRTTDQTSQKTVDYVPQDDCGKGDDASSSRFAGFTLGFGVSCSGSLYELDDIDWYQGSGLKKTTEVAFTSSGSAEACMIPAGAFSPATCGGGFVAPEAQAYDVRAMKGSSGDYHFSASLDEPNDCGTNNDAGDRSDSAPINEIHPQLLCEGDVWGPDPGSSSSGDLDGTECYEYEFGGDHTVRASGEALGEREPILTLYEDDWTEIQTSSKEVNGKTILVQDGQLDDQEYKLCYEFPDLESDDFPERYRMSLTAHRDCSGSSEWGDQDASDSEFSPTPGPNRVPMECNAMFSDHSEDHDWWAVDAGGQSSFSACIQDDLAGLGMILLDKNRNFLDAGDCVADGDPGNNSPYRVGFLGSDEPGVYSWAWG